MKERLDKLLKSKVSPLKKKTISPSLPIQKEEAVKRVKFFMDDKVPRCKNWYSKDLESFFASHPLPDEEISYVMTRIEDFVKRQEDVVAKLIEEDAERKQKLSAIDRRSMRLTHACFYPSFRGMVLKLRVTCKSVLFPSCMTF